jgi:hypothetical protein
VALCAVPPALATDPQAASETQRINPDAATLVDFTKRAAAYEALQRRLDGTLTEAPRDGRPEQFIDHQRALAQLIQRERLGARPGDVLTKETRNLMRRLLAGVLRGPDGSQLKKAILDEFTGNVRLVVNGQYPDDVPLSQMPLQILQALPKIPEILEYRFIGKNLVLLDVHARIIVDFIDKAFR